MLPSFLKRFLRQLTFRVQEGDIMQDQNALSTDSITVTEEKEENVRHLQTGIPLIIMADQKQLQEDIVKKLRTASALPNKYHYFGSHGAAAWEDVETHLEIKKEAKKLLVDEENSHPPIENILAVIKEESENPSAIDIVSLGAGTGGDDTTLLEVLSAHAISVPNLIAVDLSVSLLSRALNTISVFLRGEADLDNTTQLCGICADIDSFSEAKKAISKYSGAPRLFHLLGLTFGNNDEDAFLRNIAVAMAPNDFLLISVDCCLDTPALKQRSIESYSKLRHEVTRFLSGPLITSLNIDRAAGKKGHAQFFGNYLAQDGNRYNYIKDRIGIRAVECYEGAQSVTFSSIEGALSLGRYYVPHNRSSCNNEDVHKHGTLVDFSNKYASSQLDAWLARVCPRFHLTHMKPENNTKWQVGSQRLILLKKGDVKIALSESIQHVNDIDTALGFLYQREKTGNIANWVKGIDQRIAKLSEKKHTLNQKCTNDQDLLSLLSRYSKLSAESEKRMLESIERHLGELE
jgi:hypothetical protein